MQDVAFSGVLGTIGNRAYLNTSYGTYGLYTLEKGRPYRSYRRPTAPPCGVLYLPRAYSAVLGRRQ
jgi:hypothetical protein